MSAIPLLDTWRATGREVAVVGLGKSGVAATLLLRDHGLPVYASDTGTGGAYDAWADALGAAGAEVHLGGHDLERIGRAAAVVVAPGVPPEVPPLAAAAPGRSADLCRGGPGVSGTPGHALHRDHRDQRQDHDDVDGRPRARRGGGPRRDRGQHRPAALRRGALGRSRPNGSRWSCRSFQLHDAPHLKPAVGVLTNLAPNHLDRYASLEEYYGDKALLFRNADAGSRWVTNADDPAVEAMTRSIAGTRYRFA